MSKHIDSIYADLGTIDITQFCGPDILGKDRRCLQIGDLPGLCRTEVEELSRILIEWLRIETD